mgnify:CR=1 FL=1
MKGTVTVKLTNGFGNNIFQYVAGRLLAEYLDSELMLLPPTPDYYAIKDLKKLNVAFNSKNVTEVISINDTHYKMCFNDELRGKNILLSGYFEDYTHYIGHLDIIRSWFPSLQKRQDNDLVIHMRTGDRLFMKNEFYSKPRASNYLNAIKKFDFDNLHIVTDMPKWDYVTADELTNMKFHLNVPQSQKVPIDESVKFFNEFVDGFSKYNPSVTQRSIVDDFNFIRNSNNILFEHGTLSWWASVLSDAKKVGVYGPWRPWKGSKNKNLSSIPIKTWFKWE